MTLAMLHVDRARTRMPLVCTVISLLVLAAFMALSFTSWLVETKATARDLQDTNSVKSVHVPQSNASATSVSVGEPPDPYATESWVRHGREF